VQQDPAQAAAWFQKAADLGDAASKAELGSFLINGVEQSGVTRDAARGLALAREAFAQGHTPALYLIAGCFLLGQGVKKDAVHGVALLRQVINNADSSKADACCGLAMCYDRGTGVEADTVQAALWCQRAVTGGCEFASQLLPTIWKCELCGTAPARQLCTRCRQVRYCDAVCQAAHWNRETDPHKGHCRRAGEASEEGTAAGGGTSSSSASYTLPGICE
jgi:hypothetical protein